MVVAYGCMLVILFIASLIFISYGYTSVDYFGDSPKENPIGYICFGVGVIGIVVFMKALW